VCLAMAAPARRHVFLRHGSHMNASQSLQYMTSFGVVSPSSNMHTSQCRPTGIRPIFALRSAGTVSPNPT
jgi:hypothetical protein